MLTLAQGYYKWVGAYSHGSTYCYGEHDTMSISAKKATAVPPFRCRKLIVLSYLPAAAPLLPRLGAILEITSLAKYPSDGTWLRTGFWFAADDIAVRNLGAATPECTPV